MCSSTSQQLLNTSASLTTIVPSSTVFVRAKGSHKGLAGARGPVTAHIMLSKYCMWPDRTEYPNTVDMRKRQFQLPYCLQSTALTVGEVEAGSHVAFRVCCSNASHAEDGADQEAHPSHADCPHVSSGPPTKSAAFAFQLFGEFMKSFPCEALLVFQQKALCSPSVCP